MLRISACLSGSLLGGNGPHIASSVNHITVGFCTSKLVERYLPSTLAVITSLHEVASRYSYLYFFCKHWIGFNQSINHNRTVLYLVRQRDRDMVHVSHLPKLQKAVETCQIQECRISMLLQQSRHSTVRHMHATPLVCRSFVHSVRSVSYCCTSTITSSAAKVPVRRYEFCMHVRAQYRQIRKRRRAKSALLRALESGRR